MNDQFPNGGQRTAAHLPHQQHMPGRPLADLAPDNSGQQSPSQYQLSNFTYPDTPQQNSEASSGQAASAPLPSSFGKGKHAANRPSGHFTEPQEGGKTFDLIVPLQSAAGEINKIYTRPWTMADIRVWQKGELQGLNGLNAGIEMLVALTGLTSSQIESDMHPNDFESILKTYEADLKQYVLMAEKEAVTASASDTGRNFIFNSPVVHEGRTYEQLPFRYPTVGDTKSGSKHQLPIDASMAIYAGMSGAPIDVFLKCHPYDFHRLEAWSGPLLSPRSPSSAARETEQAEAALRAKALEILEELGSE